MLARILFVGGAACLVGSDLYITSLHKSLSDQIQRQNVSAALRKTARAAGELQSVPAEVIEQQDRFRIVHESDSKTGTVSIPSDPNEAELLLTKLLRRNMTAFSKMPTGRILRIMAKSNEQKESFSATHLQALQFQPGDVCCGMYRVVERAPLRAEMEMLVPANMGSFSGRLIISLREDGSQVVLTTETLQWTEAGSSTVMPLERSFGSFMHEIASWSLLVGGMKFLEQQSPPTW